MIKNYSVFIALLTILIMTVVPILIFQFDGEQLGLYFDISSYTMVLFILAFLIHHFFFTKDDKKTEENKINKWLKYNLNDKEIWLVDYENCSYLPKRLSGENSENVVCYVFTNSTQLERLQNEMRGISTNAFIEYILTDQKGKNLVDIELSFYAGMIYSLYKPYKVIIQSNDNGFDTVTRACNEIGFDNIENYHPVKEDLVSDNKCVWIYWHILNTKTENVMSLGNFKKRVKKSQLSITADEVNYVVKRLEEIGYIKITDNQGYKVVNFQKKKKK